MEILQKVYSRSYQIANNQQLHLHHSCPIKCNSGLNNHRPLHACILQRKINEPRASFKLVHNTEYLF